MQTDMNPLPDEQGPFLIFTNADSVVQNARFVTDAPLTPLERELCEALEALRNNIGCASLVRNPVGKRLRAQADAVIAKTKAKDRTNG